MNDFPSNSPRAVARVVAMTMITDADLHDRELELMERLRLYELLGLHPEAFVEVLRDYCEDLLARHPDARARVDLLDRDHVDAVLDCVDDPALRLETARILLNVARADGHLHPSEMALLRHALERWRLTLDDLRPPEAARA